MLRSAKKIVRAARLQRCTVIGLKFAVPSSEAGVYILCPIFVYACSLQLVKKWSNPTRNGIIIT